MSIATWFHQPKVRRGLAASAIVLSAGGLFLYRSADANQASAATITTSEGKNQVAFQADGLSGSFGLSHGKVFASRDERMFAELRLSADAREEAADLAPLSMVVVLDTSGSMSGEKLREAKRSVIRMVESMRDGDQVAIVRYSSDAQLLVPLSNVGRDRNHIIRQIEQLESSGGTDIPGGLREGIRAVSFTGDERVRRVVLVSDGLDSSRSEAEQVARRSAEDGVTVSSLGIGLDFDESYLSALSESGRGNFAFVQDPSALAKFLDRELREAANTTIESAHASITLPEGVTLRSVQGAEILRQSDQNVELRIGSMFGGDERRVILELSTDLGEGDTGAFAATVRYRPFERSEQSVELASLAIEGTNSRQQVAEDRDGQVLANATSAIASDRQVRAAEAYRRGDTDEADQLIRQNVAELEEAAIVAPKAAAESIGRQKAEYMDTQRSFQNNAPASDAGRAAAKTSVQKDIANAQRKAF